MKTILLEKINVEIQLNLMSSCFSVNLLTFLEPCFVAVVVVVVVIGKWFEPRGISYWFVVIVRVKVRTLHLTPKMTTAQVVEMSVTNNNLSKDYLHPDNHDKPIVVVIVICFFFEGHFVCKHYWSYGYLHPLFLCFYFFYLKQLLLHASYCHIILKS